jgi:hypothetical protein
VISNILGGLMLAASFGGLTLFFLVYGIAVLSMSRNRHNIFTKAYLRFLSLFSQGKKWTAQELLLQIRGHSPNTTLYAVVMFGIGFAILAMFFGMLISNIFIVLGSVDVVFLVAIGINISKVGKWKVKKVFSYILIFLCLAFVNFAVITGVTKNNATNQTLDFSDF